MLIDEFSGATEPILAIAEKLAPFPAVAGSYYPGVRRVIDEADGEAFDYVQNTCEQAAQFIAGAFDVDGFKLLEASFSMVTARPEELRSAQRAPHFDSTDPKYFALLHYLRVPPGTGTAFYRQRSTGIERVTEQNVARFVRTAEADASRLSADSGYIQGSDPYFEQIGAIEAVTDRLLIYQGSLLHSGMIPPDMELSADPSRGRLTCNIFVRGQ